MSSSEVSGVSINDIGSDAETSTYSSGSEPTMNLLTLVDNNVLFASSRKGSGHEKSVPDSLLKIGARVFAKNIPFEAIYCSDLIVPEEVQKLIAFYSFPSNEENIRLYSCLSAGSSHSFNDGVALLAKDAVRDCVQIGFYLSASVLSGEPAQLASSSFTPIHRVSLTFDRTCITSSSCTCTMEVEGIRQQSITQRNDLLTDSQTHTIPLCLPKQSGTDSGVWCPHVVATCLKRIRSPESVIYRPPISESLSKLNKNELQLFAQQLICHVGARKILPAAQSILDDILLPHASPVKGFVEGQDPTAGGLMGQTTSWRFDTSTLEEKLRNTLTRYSKTKSFFHDDLSALNSCLSQHSEEMICILRSLRTYEPRGVWDLLAIVVKMLHQRDLNSLSILQMLTRCIIEVDEIMFWWYVVQLNVVIPIRPSQVGKKKQACYGAAWLCETLVDVWRLVCLDPKLREKGSLRKKFISKLSNWHQVALTKAQRGMRVAQFSTSGSVILIEPQDNTGRLFSENNLKLFVGFKPAIQACQLSWSTEMPFTHALTKDQFMQALPNFDGAFIGESSACVEPWAYSFNPQEHTGCQSYPSMKGQFGINFARCQGLVMHGDKGEALAWVRHLALEMLSLAPSFVTAAKRAALQNLEIAAQMDPLLESIKSTDRVALLHPTGPARRYRRSLLTAVVNSSVRGVSGTTVAATSRRGGSGGGGSSLRKTTANVNPQKPSEAEQLAKLWADFYASEVAEFSATLTEWMYSVEYLMDCLYAFHYTEGLVYPPALSNQHLTRSSTISGDPEDGAFHTPSSYSSPSCFPDAPTNNFNEWFSLDVELAFRLGLLMLALPRPQHTVAAMEVRLFDHEASLLSRLYRLPLDSACPWVIESVRREAQLLADEKNRFGDCSAAYVPYSLSEFLFQMLAGSEPLQPSNALSPSTPLPPAVTEDGVEGENSSSRSVYAVSDNATAGGSNVAPSTAQPTNGVSCLPLAVRIQQLGGNFDLETSSSLRTHGPRDDGERAFALARHIFGHRTRIPEKVAPMLVECQRWQMQSFILRILRYYKDDPRRISDLIESLLDPRLNSSFRSPPLWFCLSANLEEMMQFRHESEAPLSGKTEESKDRLTIVECEKCATEDRIFVPLTPPLEDERKGDESCSGGGSANAISVTDSPFSPPEPPVADSGVENRNHHVSSEQASTSAGEDTDTLSDSKAWDKRFRCTNLRDPRRLNRHSVGMAAVDSSAPETTSSDNSPTTNRRTFLFRLPEEATSAATASGGGISGTRRRNCDSSSDCPSSSTGEESKSISRASPPVKTLVQPRTTVGCGLKCTIPDQRPTESYAQHIFQLAKSIRLAAGGPNASVSVFNAEAVTHGPTNQNLHFAAFQVSFYALGLMNLQQPSWKSRTYSRHVAWLSQQIFEIELPAAFMLLHSWRNHFTTEEVTAVAYQLFKRGNQSLSKLAGELCLSSLTDCTTLKSEAIKCALSQLSAMPEMLERGLLCIEEEVNTPPFGIVPDLHFQLATYWFQLYETTKHRLPKRRALTKGVTAPPMPSSVPVAEARPPTNDYNAWPGDFQRPVHPSISECVYFPSSNLNPIAAATASGPALVQALGQSFSSPFYPIFPVQLPQQVNVPLQPMQQVTTPSLVPPVCEIYSRQSGLCTTSTSSVISPQTAPLTQDDIEDYLHRTTLTEDDESSEPSVYITPVSAAVESLEPTNLGVSPFREEDVSTEREEGESQTETSVEAGPSTCLNTDEPIDENDIRELERKARNFLLRSFRSFLYGIEKLFPTQTPQLVSTSPQSRCGGDKFCHWQHRHHHLDGENVSALFQHDSLVNRMPVTDVRGDDYTPWNADKRPWAGCGESRTSSEKNILRALEVAEMLGDGAVSIYCKRMIKCIPCPLIMTAITTKVLRNHFSNCFVSSATPLHPQCGTGGYPWCSSMALYPVVPMGPPVYNPQWESKLFLQQHQMPIYATVDEKTITDTITNPLNIELLEHMVNRIHFLFHLQINTHLRHLSRSQEGWGELVDMVLSAYLADQRIPSKNKALSWEYLFRRIEQYSRNAPALLERVVASIETVNMRFPPPSITAALAAATRFNGILSGGPPPQLPPSSS